MREWRHAMGLRSGYFWMTAVRFARSFEGVGGIGSLRLCARPTDMDEAEADRPCEIRANYSCRRFG